MRRPTRSRLGPVPRRTTGSGRLSETQELRERAAHEAHEVTETAATEAQHLRDTAAREAHELTETAARQR